MSQTVAATAPGGQYTYTVNVGSFPDTVEASASFTFAKQSAVN
jgi:hypothetical protein